MKCIGEQDIKALKNIFRGVYSKLTQYDKDALNNHHRLRTVEFQSWCQDVVIFYCSRVLLMQKPIPIVERDYCDEHNICMLARMSERNVCVPRLDTQASMTRLANHARDLLKKTRDDWYIRIGQKKANK